MSAGIAAAMIRAVCKHRNILTQVDPEEAIAFYGLFSPMCLHTLEAFFDVVDSIVPVHRFVILCHRLLFIVCKVFWVQLSNRIN